MINSFFPFSLECEPLTSRVHALRGYSGDGWQGYVKRDDELSFGVSGCKARKYLSLLPYYEQQEVKEVAVIGGAFSNHVLGISQRLIEKGIRPTLFLRGEKPLHSKGNFLLTSLLVPSTSMRWISRQEWSSVDLIAANYVEEQKLKGINASLLPEGAAIEPSLIGALTLGWDILNNEKTLDISFDHIFIDSGTGLSAIGLLLYLGWAGKSTQLHILQLAGDSLFFEKQLARFRIAFEQIIGQKMSKLPFYKTYQPIQGRSFGTVNSAVFRTIHEIASTEGFLVDPIYSAKLFAEARNIIPRETLKGNILIIHSGGGLTLSGFQEQLGSC